MNRYIRLIEQEIAAVIANIDRHKGCGVFHNNCIVWGHHLAAYQRILEILTEAERPKGKRVTPSRPA